MENQDSYSSGNVSGQAQTGSQVKNMAYGAAEVGKGAAQGAINLARGAADAVKNSIGINNNNNDVTIPTTIPRGGATTINANSNTATIPNLMDSNNIDLEGLSYPTNTMSDPNCHRNQSH
ncbi:late embryogenesis abundant protein-related [Striga asiatica]|uniref:Late embryogenesis abundant protein-related n=1 Tax=Striga asiatica TaxID=4170 RepID=A0A5A7PHG3_STRAF|nr:late embryogenesis abundant protein-related [Striga asiatica]